MDEQQERIRGAEAEQLLRNPLLVEALQTLETNIVNRLADKNLKAEEITHLQGLLVCKRSVERYLTQLVTTGTMAQLAEQEKRSFADRILRRA